MLKTFSIQEVLKARTQDLEDMLAECMECEARTGIYFFYFFTLKIINNKLNFNI